MFFLCAVCDVVEHPSTRNENECNSAETFSLQLMRGFVHFCDQNLFALFFLYVLRSMSEWFCVPRKHKNRISITTRKSIKSPIIELFYIFSSRRSPSSYFFLLRKRTEKPRDNSMDGITDIHWIGLPADTFMGRNEKSNNKHRKQKLMVKKSNTLERNGRIRKIDKKSVVNNKNCITNRRWIAELLQF